MGGTAAAKEGERQGDFLGGKYLLEDCLGIGGMGEVYRATNVSLGRKVAIKLLNKEHTANEDDVMRFLREARAAATVRHPNVVDVFDVGRDDDGTPFIVQELLSGQDLEQYLGAGGGKVGTAEALEIMIPVADAVAAAHAHSVVHRDLKPANIFLAREGKRIIPKVLDFGACLYQTVGALSAKEQRMLIGTPHYMAPEQITTAMDVDVRADVWAIGVIIYEVLVGETPFEAEDANTVLKLVRTRQVPRLRKVAPEAPVALEELVSRCLDRDRRKRFADCAVVRDELDKIRASLRGAVRTRADTQPEVEDSEIKVKPSATAAAAAASRADAEPPSQRIPSLVLKGGKPATKRRGSALLTLSSPESVPPDPDAPVSASRPIEPAIPRELPRSGPKPARLPADLVRELDLPPAPASARLPSAPPPGRVGSAPPARSPSPSPPAPISRPKEAGAPRDIDFDEHSSPGLDLDLSAPASRRTGHTHSPGHSSIPPVLDPRAAGSSSAAASVASAFGGARSERPPAVTTPDAAAARISRADLSREAREARETPPPLTPALSPPLPGSAGPVSQRGGPRASSASLPSSEGQKAWSPRAKATFAASIVLPALVAFVALRFAPFVMAPIGHAMRGDTPLASGVLAVLTLVGAAALATRALGASRSTGTLVATIGAVVLGIVMIIVTFSASETAELEIPPAAGGIVPFIAPIIPLGLGLVSLGRARELWLSQYDRGDAIKMVALTTFMLFAVLELGPLGAVKAATSGAPAAPAAPAAPRPPP